MTGTAVDTPPSATRAPATQPVSLGEPVCGEAFAAVRRRMLLECCKWDPQVGDVSTLAPFPLLIGHDDWRTVASLAERLAAELTSAERELLGRPGLWPRLAIPRRLRQIFGRADIDCHLTGQPGVRVLRFDFHWTDAGWRISEVNSDVPGGYAEGSAFPRMMAAHIAGARPVGDPAAVWADAFAAAAGDEGGHVALLAAPGFMEDQQVVGYLARVLATRGFVPHLANVRALRWAAGRPYLDAGSRRLALAGVVRFHQAEWLARLPRGAWEPLFTSGRVPVVNPGYAVLTESKRFPLIWGALRTPLPTWARLLPETRDPREARWRDDDGWLLKSAFCNTGDTVASPGLVPAKHWRSASRSAWLFPGQWVAQRRFHTLPIAAPSGALMYPCLGVYTVNGRAAGAYARLSHGPIVDYRAVDAAVLVRDAGNSDNDDEGGGRRGGPR